MRELQWVIHSLFMAKNKDYILYLKRKGFLNQKRITFPIMEVFYL